MYKESTEERSKRFEQGTISLDYKRVEAVAMKPVKGKRKGSREGKVKRNPRRYGEGEGWSSRKPIHVSRKMHQEAMVLAGLGLPIGKSLGEVVESGIKLLMVKYRKEIKQQHSNFGDEGMLYEGHSPSTSPLVDSYSIFNGE